MKQSIINTLRKSYSSMEEAYLVENSKEPNICKICSKRSRFISFFKGYHEICGSEKCKREYFLIKNREKSLNKKEQNKISVKCSVCEKKEILVQNTKKITTKSIICDSEYCQRNKEKNFILERDIIKNLETSDVSCINRCIYDLIIKYKKIDKVRRVLYKNLLLNGIENYKSFLNDPIFSNLLISKKYIPDNYYLTLDGKYYISLEYKYKNDLLKKIYGNCYDEYLFKYYPENAKKCKICKNKYIYKNIFGNNTKKKSENTCSLKCYFKNFKHYSTPERNKKISDGIKKSIQRGDFTPNIFNSNTRKNLSVNWDNRIYLFRSSWEILFFIWYGKDLLEYEKIRIPYYYEEKEKIYLVDFVDEINRKVFEIKPFFLKENKINSIKNKKLEEWSIDNNYEMISITEKDLKKIPLHKILEKIRLENIQIDEDIIKKITKLINK